MLLNQGIERSYANRPRLKSIVLGGEGVVFRSRTDDFLALIATSVRQPVAAVAARWERVVRAPFWSGQMSDADAWRALTGSRRVPASFRFPLALYAAGPAMIRLQAWSAQLDVWLVCNHRSSWLYPFLEQEDAFSAFSEVRVSDRTGRLKPSASAFRQLLPFVRPEETLVVDSRLQSLSVASGCGFRTLQARGKNDWVVQIDAQMEQVLPEARRRRA